MILRRVLTITLIAGLLAAAALAAFARGGYERLYWIPVGVILVCLLAMVVIGQNHDYLSRHINLRVAIPFALYLFWAGFSYPGSIDRESTYFELFRLFTLGTVLLLASVAFDNRWEKWALALGLCLIGCAEALYGLTERATGQALLPFAFLPHDFRQVIGTFGNRNHFADFLNMSFFLGLGLLASRGSLPSPSAERLAQKIIFTLPLAVLFVALVLTISRGGWFCFGIGFMVWLWLLWRHQRPGLARVPLAAALVLAVGLMFVARMDLTPVQQRIATFEEIYHQPDELTGEGRVSIWKSTLRMIKDRPVFGTGLGTYRWAFPAYREKNLFYGVRFAHNDYLQMAAEIGVPGLILWCIFIYMLLREAMRTIRRHPYAPDSQAVMAITAGLVAVLTHELIDFGLAVPANAIMFYGMAAIVICAEDGR